MELSSTVLQICKQKYSTVFQKEPWKKVSKFGRLHTTKIRREDVTFTSERKFLQNSSQVVMPSCTQHYMQVDTHNSSNRG